MGREQEEDVLRITAQYVDKARAGHQPEMSNYLARYPQYADEIANFVAYYHAFEADLPPETNMAAELPEGLLIAIDSAWERVLHSRAIGTDKITTLLVTASKQHLTLAQLASRIGLSIDVVRKLEQRKIQASSIPQKLYGQLAKVLQQSFEGIAAYFEPSWGGPAQQLAEAQTPYQVNKRPYVQAQSFREALEESAQLSEKQKQIWREVLSHEGL